MHYEEVRKEVAGTPYLTPERGKVLYDFIISERPQECLELGFAHGVSTCYIAAALEANGSGHLTSVDLETSGSLDPAAETLLERCGLTHRVTVVREPTSYTWFLKKEIAGRSTGPTCEPRFDFAFIDGAKNWTIDGLAFFLVDKLLQQDGWILFDDYRWTYAAHEAHGYATGDGVTIRTLSEDEKSEAHVEAIFQLLVMQHPDYSEFKVQDDIWAWARKTQAAKRTLSIEETARLDALAARVLRRGLHQLKGKVARTNTTQGAHR